MSNIDAPTKPDAQLAQSPDAGAAVGEAATASSAGEAAATAEPAEKELLCTLCGLRACWTS
jgi:hypothetical protein